MIYIFKEFEWVHTNLLVTSKRLLTQSVTLSGKAESTILLDRIVIYMQAGLCVPLRTFVHLLITSVRASLKSFIPCSQPLHWVSVTGQCTSLHFQRGTLPVQSPPSRLHFWIFAPLSISYPWRFIFRCSTPPLYTIILLSCFIQLNHTSP